MQIVKYIFIWFLLIGCTEETKMNEKTVNTEYAKKDGFEIIAFEKDKPKSIRYQEYDKKDKQMTYLVPDNKLESIESILRKNQNSSDFFVKLYTENINKEQQEICLEYHYSKSTYKYCYTVIGNKVVPKYSEYHDLFKNKKINYK
jgi:hypothetical protein